MLSCGKDTTLQTDFLQLGQFYSDGKKELLCLIRIINPMNVGQEKDNHKRLSTRVSKERCLAAEVPHGAFFFLGGRK